ncbi:filamentous hemagglutinin N-terminal domain-containing protein [Waterburya agarophytonicola K14]|uniref:Filamentous hemagglutinin N-terminal domain-containing protein n=1 Tax=Waterburya agarophytonicola KI4 TaxID=2874699 RepID=A0A964BPK2_9CYAN|nr:filamentous hemagglutinin N-terminal domain-containing protein [Waterburya agarophytonicola]MCC0177214.1 filamentous hemagglutinin N-terminal domain-containing protein [Waterburya agarophytonicola KI4]
MNFKLQFSLLLCSIVGFIDNPLTAKSALAQVTTDGTTGTTVNADGNNFEINNGTTNGNNLFHSFQDFSVPGGGEAFFNNASEISNILSRVTGGNISNIQGAIRANNSANLFLINPAGIVFGQNASLDIGGSFYGSTADSILFEDGEFSAVNNLDAPILTINAPIGLNLRNNPNPITNQSFFTNNDGDFVGLEVSSGQTIGLIGGDVNFEAGEATAPGGLIAVGGLLDAGTISIEPNGNLSFPENVARANVSLSNNGIIDVRGTGGGDISIHANNVEMLGGDFGGSVLQAGITTDSISTEAQAGDIAIDARSLTMTGGSQIQNFVAGANEDIPGGQGNAGNVVIEIEGDIAIAGSNQDGNLRSAIFSDVESGATGNGGNIIISANSLSLNEGSFLTSTTSGVGNAGNIAINVDGNTELIDSNIFSQVAADAVGEGGTITVNTTNLSLLDGSQITAGVFGTGNAGTVTINAADNITFQGIGSDGLASGIVNNVAASGIGNAGNIDVTTANLNLVDGGTIRSNVLGQGNGGQIKINASNAINVSGFTEFDEATTRFSSIESSTFSTAEETNNAGNIDITAGSLSLSNQASLSSGTSGNGSAGSILLNINGITELIDSNIFSQVAPGGVGEGGTITVNTTNLSLLEGSQISSGVFGTGNAGIVTINAADTITFQGINENGFPSGIVNNVAASGIGNAGNIDVTTANLNLVNGGTIGSSVIGEGNGGNIVLDIGGNTELTDSNISSQVGETGTGSAGTITLNTTNLSLLEGSQISAGVFGTGNAGTVTINAANNITFQGINENGFASGIVNDVAASGIGNAGNIDVTTANLNLVDGGTIRSNVLGQGNGGQIKINASNAINVSGFTEFNEAITRFSSIESSTFSTAEGINNAGNIDITAGSLSLSNQAFLSSGTLGNGNAGSILLNVNGITELIDSNIFSQVAADAVGEGGTITLNTTNLSLLEGSQITAGVFGRGNAGTVTINAANNITFQGIDENGFASGILNNVAASGIGNAGNIDVTTANLNLVDGGTILSNVLGQGNGGQIAINASNAVNVSGFTVFNEQITRLSEISNSTANGSIGDAGNIEIRAASLSLSNQTELDNSIFGEGNAGNIVLNISGNTELTDSNIFSQVGAGGEGDGGTITLNTTNLSLLEGSQISAGVFGTGDGGSVTINASDTITFQGIDSDGFASGILNNVAASGVGNGGDIEITTTNLNLIDGGSIASDIFGSGSGGAIAITANNAINVSGFTIFDEQTTRVSGITSSVGTGANGSGGNINITTPNLGIVDGARIAAGSEGSGDSGDLTFNIGDRLTLRENSTISVEATQENANGGDITINAPSGFVVAFPSENDGDGNDISAFSNGGAGGNITIEALGVLGLEERDIGAGNNTNDIDASGDIDDGNVEIITPNADAIEGSTELSGIPIESGETIAQTCSTNRGIANSNLVIVGKGGVANSASDTLTSQIISIDGQTTEVKSPSQEQLQPISTSQGNIIPAQGVEITEDGEIILTAYKTTQNARTPHISVNCNQS